jgi:hypothetical protein
LTLKIQLFTKFSLRIIPLLLISYLIQACGGGSSGSAPIEETREYTFTLTSLLTNDCGATAAFNDVELFLQDENWQIIERYIPDQNGRISLITNTQKINYTLIAKSQTANQVEGLQIKSYYQADATEPAVYQAQHDTLIDNSSCECITQNVNISHRSFASRTHVNSSSEFESWQAINEGTTELNGVQVCRTLGQDWPLHSFWIIGTDINQNLIGNAVFSSQFDATTGDVWDLSAFDVAEQVSLPQTHQAFENNQIIRSQAHFPWSISENDESLLLFKSHNYIGEALYQSNAKVVFQETSSILGTTSIESNHQVISSSHDESFTASAANNKPNIDDVNFSEIQADGSYDYSAVPDHPMAIITFVYNVFSSQSREMIPITWTTFGPIQGQLPINSPLTGYEDLINNDSEWNELIVELQQSSSSNDYTDYINHSQNRNLSFGNNLKNYHIKITK